MPANEPALGLTDILVKLADEPDGSELSLVSVVETMQGRGFGPLLLAPTLMVLLPTGAIPGVPTLSALLIMLVAGQLVFGKRAPWVPGRLRQMSFERARFRAAVETTSRSPLSSPSSSPSSHSRGSVPSQVGRAKLIELVDSASAALGKPAEFEAAATRLCQFVANAGFAVIVLQLGEVRCKCCPGE